MINLNKCTLKRGLVITGFLVGFMGLIQAAQASGTLNSAQITASTLSAVPNCLHYQVKGVCFWQYNGVVNQTDYVVHYLPDVVLTVFNEPGDNPWFEIKNTLDVAAGEAQKGIISALTGDKAGGGQHVFNNPLIQNTFFKEVDVVGNPALVSLTNPVLFLPSTAGPGVPYFQSMLDSALWRGFSPQADPEQAYAASVALVRYIGKDAGTVTWGTAVPFEGKIQTSNDAKAAAVVAQRAGNLVTTSGASGFGHVYQTLGTSCGTQCTAANIKENNNDTQFQLIYPTSEATCQRFGQTITFGEDMETKTQGAYAWVLWRKYEGCIPGVGSYVGKVVS